MALEKILVIGKDSKTQQLARPFTNQLFAADDIKDAHNLINSTLPNLILLSPDITTTQIKTFITNINTDKPNIPIVTVGTNDDENNLGAYDCLSDNDDVQKFTHIINNIKNQSDDDSESRYFCQHCPPDIPIVGTSKAMEQTLKMTQLVARSTCNPVLIIGETGTGKELAAKALHTLRHGPNKEFVALNCAALTANLLESELFGHVKGSFTSADREKTGLLEIAGDGTVFLDEISEMPLDLQAKLLRVLQEKTFRKVGGVKDIQCNATIVASSNRKLLEEVKNKKFRSDLYYRLAICPITIAPLRSTTRRDDVLLLAEYFINNSTICPEKIGKIKGLTRLAAEALQKHNWPGNVRELQNVIQRAILLESTDKIGLTNLLINPEQAAHPEMNTVSIGIKDFSLERAEKELISKALNEAGWQKTRAATMLGITRATLYAKVKQYDIKQTAPKTEQPVLT